EARLAREAEISYATIAMATDYDCWHDSHDDVSVDAVIQIMHKNVEGAKRLIRVAAPQAAALERTSCDDALRNAIMTAPDRISPEARTRLALFLDKYLQD
ncbi:MAG: S-methyl-5'-thioadenosine phosphorylase, partial [Planctomycetes bacterium]|nr:S-methyl-5'-thioadenosine phosphorylase [Planctomycetota bacterium]